jgi:WD40 repeat protein
VFAAVFSADGRQVATAGADGTAQLFEIASGGCVRTLTDHSGPVNSVAFRPGGGQLATGGADSTAKLWAL